MFRQMLVCLGILEPKPPRVPVFTGENRQEFLQALREVFPRLGAGLQVTVHPSEPGRAPKAPISVAYLTPNYGLIVHSYCVRGSRLSLCIGKRDPHNPGALSWHSSSPGLWCEHDPWDGTCSPDITAALDVLLSDEAARCPNS